MRKMVVVVVALIILILFPSAISESDEYRDMPFEQLALLKKAIDIEYYSRKEAEATIISPGVYVIGEDLPEGTWYYRVKEASIKDNCGDYVFYPNQEAYNENNKTNAYQGHIYYGSIGSCFFSKGNVLIISGAPMLFSLSKEKVDNIPVYETPEGTRVRPGKYIVGKDLPIGYYYVLAASVDSSYFGIYKNEAWSDLVYASADEAYRITVDKDDVGLLVNLQNENAIVIEDNDVIMRKREDEPLYFD